MPGVGVIATAVVVDPAWPGLVDVAAFKGELGISGGAQDAYLKTLVAQAGAAIARHCNRVVAPCTVTDVILPPSDAYPYQVPAAPGPLRLSTFPVSMMASLVADGVALVADVDALVDRGLGLVYRLDGFGQVASWTATRVVATYRAGFEIVPPDLADAATRLMKARWFARARDPGLRSESIPGVIDQSFWFASGPGSDGALPPDVQGLLAPWRLVVTA